MTTTSVEGYRLGPVEAIPPGEGRAYRVAEREVAIFRTRSGEVYATQARCPHRGAPLADGLVGGGRVLCPFHAYAFDLATGRELANGCPHLQTYPVSVTPEGEILLGLEDEDQAQPYLG
jgi:nitrite reductase (NADH) small subunit